MGILTKQPYTPRRIKKRNRNRNIIWFSRPYNKIVKKKCWKIFIKLINRLSCIIQATQNIQ